MSKSTADDLVVAFRSLERRRHEAIEAADGAAVADLLAELDRHVAAAASLVASAAGAGAVAAALAARPGEDWEETTLDAVREHATQAGSALRRVADAGRRGDRDDE